MNENGTKPHQCGTCKHWNRGPIDVNALGQPANGQCRFGPPTPTAIPQSGGLVVVCNYPTVPANFPACGQHAERFALVEPMQ